MLALLLGDLWVKLMFVTAAVVPITGIKLSN